MSIVQTLRRIFCPEPQPSVAPVAAQPTPLFSYNHTDRYPSNAAGPFYVLNNECIACGAPEMEAEGLMSHDDASGHCFFLAQPSTPDEVNAAIRATAVSCCGAVRYGGHDHAILTRFAEIGETSCCDHPLLTDIPPAHRTVARFEYADPAFTATPASVVRRISSLMAPSYSEHTAFLSDKTSASFRIIWGRYKGNEAGHSIRVSIQRVSGPQWTLSLSENELAAKWTAIGIDQALRKSSEFRLLKWIKREEAHLSNPEERDHPY